jgi:hypothetical protein
VTHALVSLVRDDQTARERATAQREDAYGSAIAWASRRAAEVLAPAVAPDRLARIFDAAARAGLALVEPESAALGSGLGRIRGLRSPRSRALLATVALGAAARPMLLVPSSRAPRGSLGRLKVDRVADGWVATVPGNVLGSFPANLPGSSETELVRTARSVLHDAARGGRGPMPFRELLREARDRWSAEARAKGARVTPSATDSSDLAAALHRWFLVDEVRLYALDPEKPGWSLTALGRGLTL